MFFPPSSIKRQRRYVFSGLNVPGRLHGIFGFGRPTGWRVSQSRCASGGRQQRDVHVHLVLAHGGGRAVRYVQHGVLHRCDRRERDRQERRRGSFSRVLLFSYGMRAVYIESCALFVRGGVYRIVKEALGGFWAKAAVSALLFDYVLPVRSAAFPLGNTSSGCCWKLHHDCFGIEVDDSVRDMLKAWGSVAIACTVTVYFLHQNLLGIHESSGKALEDHDGNHGDGRRHAHVERLDACHKRACR